MQVKAILGDGWLASVAYTLTQCANRYLHLSRQDCPLPPGINEASIGAARSVWVDGYSALFFLGGDAITCLTELNDVIAQLTLTHNQFRHLKLA